MSLKREGSHTSAAKCDCKIECSPCSLRCHQIRARNQKLGICFRRGRQTRQDRAISSAQISRLECQDVRVALVSSMFWSLVASCIFT